MRPPTATKRLGIVVSGTVQGVGFRPFVHSLAKLHKLTGFVRNNDGAVEIEIQGDESSLQQFARDLKLKAPPLSSILQIETMALDAVLEDEFRIKESTSSHCHTKLVCPDSALCPQCKEELFDPEDRRYRYPFINCTNCGPRFTIITSLPYDRAQTTMRPFEMCSQCKDEYDNPNSRRFHAQPNACALCGPSLLMKTIDGSYVGENALSKTVSALSDGKIVAIKSLGGFHLVCDAQNCGAVKLLRKRKRREFKPFALMMRDLEMVRQHCLVDSDEELALLTPAHPIVLLRRHPLSTVSAEVAPGSDTIGVMLPYTPLHHLIANDIGKPLVATSGNQRDEPIAIANEEAHTRLASLADAWLEHDRDIHFRFDDSIVQIIDGTKSVMRRARGMAPSPITLPFQTPLTILATGGQLKNTFCLVKDNLAYLSPHIGNLDTIETAQHFQDTLAKFQNLFHMTPQVIACDMHPDYQSSRIAEAIAKAHDLPLFHVQHHHAHTVACMIEHGLTDTVIGVVFDGLGYGTDDTIWGGEFFLANQKTFQRLAHFKPVPMPGGANAARNPWRMALGYIFDGAQDAAEKFAPFVGALEGKYGKSVVHSIERQIKSGVNTPLTSSCGRLFDACSAILGVCDHNEYEGQAAIELEVRARSHVEKIGGDFDRIPTYPFEIATTNESQVVDTFPVLYNAYDDLLDGISQETIAAKFHVTVAQIVAQICLRLREYSGVETVCLTGGVFQNKLLMQSTKVQLSRHQFKIYTPQEIPSNDGGISLGQAAVAAANLATSDSNSIEEEN